ncbi:HSP20 family molecular chaperone IbpA [Caldalkalibacillus uzonensis]|uniref:HSP20 family molecular chaperone IbpA n=1 Tax=Caldalkalibacillus uzonensis TaxID=353224 RepID=A0ABU0CRA4_9BACI|nr:Hsp20/alpha crystallin family protein [Caldalkalibacillus uzonensis]MDQ0338950.1 HSP20 family molecular chaperone IbpA [Caldalkalibacillus uzonensis]
MIPNDMDLNQWKTYAQRLLGRDFFADFAADFDMHNTEPKYNIYRSASEIIVLINLPYVRDLSQIKLNVREQELFIKGKIDLGYEHMETVQNQIFSGSFEKTISLPALVNTKRVNAQYQRGILKVQLFPKLRGEGKAVNIEDI